MKKILFLIAAIFLVLTNSYTQTVIQSNFTSVLVPKYICSGTSTRLPYIYRATVSGLTPNATYRYYTQAIRYTDIGGTNSGAGNPVLINGTNFRYTTSTSLITPTGYDSLTTNGSGSYTGWFGFVHTGNARFTAGNYIIPTITLDSMQNGSARYRFALNDSIFVLKFSDSTITTAGTGIYGVTQMSAKNIVSLYDNINNTGRPLSVAYIEGVGIDTTTMASLVPYYKDSVITRPGRWGSVIPNILTTGVRRVNIHNIATGNIVNFNIDSNGVWPSGANTVNPTGGSAIPIRMTASDILVSITKSGNIIPDKFALEQNYPNPFNPTTRINFNLPENAKVMLKIYDIAGKEISTLINENLNAGYYTVNFNGSNLSSGIYFYKIFMADFTKVLKMTLIK